MRSAGTLRHTVAFYRLDTTTDDYGNVSSGYAATPLCTRKADLQLQRGRERIESGRLEDAVAGVLTVRNDPDTRLVTAADKVVVDGVDYQIRGVPTPVLWNRFLEFAVERGVAI